MGLNDHELWQQIRGKGGRLERVVLPSNLPEVDFSITSESIIDAQDIQSLPPGRPGQRTEKRNRSSSGSENGSYGKTKFYRREDDAFRTALE